MNNLDKTMNTNEQENYDSTNEAEETVNNEEDEVEEQEDDVDSLRDKLAAIEKENKTLKFQKAKLKDKANEKPAPKQESKSQGELSSQDLIAIMRSDVPEDDIDDVREYANMKGISIKEALGSNVVKSILSDKAEQRNVASASNTGPSKRTSNTISDEQLVKNAASGKLPESDEDMRRLIKARRK